MTAVDAQRRAPRQGCVTHLLRRHGSSKQMRDVLLENQQNTQEKKNSTAAGQAQGLRVRLGLCPVPASTC